jgi:hypothetical protein
MKPTSNYGNGNLNLVKKTMSRADQGMNTLSGSLGSQDLENVTHNSKNFTWKNS